MKPGINDREMILPQKRIQEACINIRQQSKKSALAERKNRSRVCQDRGFARSEAGCAYAHAADGNVPITLMINRKVSKRHGLGTPTFQPWICIF